MLHITNLTKRYADKLIFKNISFVINRGEHVALIGPNGSGKTTLLHIIMGLEKGDTGNVRLNPDSTRLGYLPQALNFAAGQTVGDVLAQMTAEHSQAWADMQTYAQKMSQADTPEALALANEEYTTAENRFEAAGGYLLETRLTAILSGLNLSDISPTLPVSKLSGGQKTRLGLAILLLQQPHLLILDEPTNHLDIEALTWLETWLNNYEGAVLIVSHNRTFLDNTTTRSFVLDNVNYSLRDFPGNYSAYRAALAHETAQQHQAWQQQQGEIAKLQRAAQHVRQQARFKKGGKSDTNDKFAKAHFANRTTHTMSKAKNLERRLNALQTTESITRPAQQWALNLDFKTDTGGARRVLHLKNICMGFYDLTLFKDVTLTLQHGQRVAVTGPNGVGKTTLLRLITGDLTPSSGQVQVGHGVKIGYLAQEQEVLDLQATPYDTIQAIMTNSNQTDVRRFLHHYLFKDDEVFVKVSHLSFGERTRLMLACLVARGCNFLLLDEPLNHLDLTSREQFETALDHFPGTVLMVGHDRAFIDHFATHFWEIKGQRINVTYSLTQNGL